MKLPKARNLNIVVQTLGNETLIYDLDTHKAFNLNDTSSVVYNHCDGVQTFQDLKRKYKFSDDLINFALDELQANNLLDGDRRAHFAGLSRREVVRKVGLASLVALPVVAGLVAPRAAVAASCSNTTSDVNNCGRCGNRCSFRNATAACRNGTCQLAACNQGFANCDNDPSDGCDTDLRNDIGNCGACRNFCDPPVNANATAIGCSNGQCVILGCMSGFANCDGSFSNGCETNLNTSRTNCGACGRACSGAKPNCLNGICVG